MKKLIIFILLVVAGWYGWNHRDILTRGASHEALIVNRSGRVMARVRLTVGGKTFVRDNIPDDSSTSFSFRVADDSEFDLVWQWENSDVDQRWHGGRVPRGPMVQRHTLTVDGDGGVIYAAENKLGS